MLLKLLESAKLNENVNNATLKRCLISIVNATYGNSLNPDDYEVHHIDLDPTNAKYSNLLLVSRSAHKHIHSDARKDLKNHNIAKDSEKYDFYYRYLVANKVEENFPHIISIKKLIDG